MNTVGWLTADWFTNNRRPLLKGVCTKRVLVYKNVPFWQSHSWHWLNLTIIYKTHDQAWRIERIWARLCILWGQCQWPSPMVLPTCTGKADETVQGRVKEPKTKQKDSRRTRHLCHESRPYMDLRNTTSSGKHPVTMGSLQTRLLLENTLSQWAAAQRMWLVEFSENPCKSTLHFLSTDLSHWKFTETQVNIWHTWKHISNIYMYVLIRGRQSPSASWCIQKRWLTAEEFLERKLILSPSKNLWSVRFSKSTQLAELVHDKCCQCC